VFAQEPDPSSPLGQLQIRARRVPLWIRVPVLLVAFLAPVACAVLDLPPYTLFAAIQAAILSGEHYPMLSFVLSMLVFVLPAGLFIQLLAGLFPEKVSPAAGGQYPQSWVGPAAGGQYPQSWVSPASPPPPPQQPPYGPHGWRP
jgi:hypothetical protein